MWMTDRLDLMLGDCLECLTELPDNSVDSIVTDPPYGLSKEPDMAEVLRHWLAGDDYVHKGKGFMGKSWDSFVPGPSIWRECLRVLKPGGHLLAFFGTRTHDLGTLAIRLAGFEIRDTVMWVYGSGFPKSMDVSKAIDKAAGVARIPTGRVKPGHEGFANRGNMSSVQSLKGTMGGEGGFARPWMDDPEKVEAYHQETAPGSPEAAQWQGWGTALKPAVEPITIARKPLIGTVAANVLAHGTGALNIDGCRVPTEDSLGGGMVSKGRPKVSEGWDRPWMHDVEITERKKQESALKVAAAEALGRWPANLIHDGSDAVLALFPDSKGQQGDVRGDEPSGVTDEIYGKFAGRVPAAKRGDSGSAARFFYAPKASKKDREEGNAHPTVKPTDLMAYLCRLVTPPGGVVLDPFMGSGSTGKAAMREGFRFIGIEREEAYFDIAEARIVAAMEAADEG